MRVLVLSYNVCANFGDRLGLDLIIRLLPPEAEICISPLPPFWKKPEGFFDLVVVGTGHSIFHKTLDKQLIDFLREQKSVVGVFGLQYHELLPAEEMNEFFSSIDCWFSRSKYDIDFLRRNASLPRRFAHLGDWLINAFPIVSWVDESTCQIGPDFINTERDIQRTIQEIQKFRRISSARLHPVLCALASADEVSFQEQAEMGSQCVSGKFRSMFLDIFGKSPEPGEWFRVERCIVQSYKSLVYTKTELMREFIWTTLGKSFALRTEEESLTSFICISSDQI
jgi:hypothetical protein